MNKLVAGLAMTCAVMMALRAEAAAVGEAAPAFEAKDTKGQAHKLADFKGKYLVLEWTNPGCPYVQKHYKPGHMQGLQKSWTGKGVAWLTIESGGNSRSPDAAEKWNKRADEQGIASTALLLDPDGTVGRAFGAKTTPHMFVVDPEGKLIYGGAIDDKSGVDVEELATAKNYVSAALEEAMAGKPVTTAQSKPYGCGVKY